MAQIQKCKVCGRMTSIRISWSALRSHIECHQKSFLQRSGKKAKMEDQRVFFPGTVTDRVVRDWLSNDPELHPGAMVEMVEDYVNKEEAKILAAGKTLRWRDPEDKQNIIEECQQAVRDIEPYLNKYVLPYEYDVDFKFEAPIKTTHPVTGEPATIILNGFMDIIVRMAEDKWAVYDVKHTRNEEYWRKTRGQLSFYDLAVDVMFGTGTVVVGLLQPLCKEKLKPFVLEESDRTILMKHVLDMANDVWLNNNEVNPEADCFFCNVKHACSKFLPVKSSDGKRRVPLV